MNSSTIRYPLLYVLLCFVALLSACGGGDGGNGGGGATYTIGGSVSGLVGSGLVLRNNGVDSLNIASDGTFTFATGLNDGASYAVTVAAQPGSPSQLCLVSYGTGTVNGADVRDVSVTCSAAGGAYSVGGAVSGLRGTGLVLLNNGADDLSVQSDGPFTFATPVADGTGYEVTVGTQPAHPRQTCLVSNGSDTVNGDNVNTVAVACTVNTYALGGMVSGLIGTGLVLQNNGGSSLNIASNGTFTFGSPVEDGTGYHVTVSTPPGNPSQECLVSNGTGTMDGANVGNVTVNCALPAPSVTVAFGVKQVVLSWGAVGGATYYRVLKNPDGYSGYAQISGNLAVETYTDSVSVHLTDWVNLRYEVEACNGNGCTASSPVGPLDSALAIGYVKPGVTIGNDLFGHSVAISGDGNTLAVGMPNENSAATGINNILPGPSDTSAFHSGAVDVYSRDGATGLWSLQAYIKTAFTDTTQTDTFGWSVALSSDGSILAVGAPGESSAATGVNSVSPGPSDNSASASGAAYVFTRTGSSWSQQAYLKASNTGANDNFGTSVALSSDGITLAIGAIGESSAATGVNNSTPGQGDNSIEGSGAVYMFISGGGSWFQQAYVKASNPGQLDSFGQSIALSGDGNTLAVGAPYEESAASGINNTVPGQGDNSASRSGAVYAFTRTSGVWSQQAYIKASNPDPGDFFGQSVALSSDGNALIAGAPSEDGDGVGPYSTQTNALSDTGAAYLFNRVNGTWLQRVYIKASNNSVAFVDFGYAVAISADGLSLAVGAPWENGASTGIDNTAAGQAYSYAAANSGAVYFFQFDTTPMAKHPWHQKAYVKAHNTDSGDLFGVALSLSGDATMMAVGACYEDSTTTGIHAGSAGPGNNNGIDIGAVYLY